MENLIDSLLEYVSFFELIDLNKVIPCEIGGKFLRKSFHEALLNRKNHFTVACILKQIHKDKVVSIGCNHFYYFKDHWKYENRDSPFWRCYSAVIFDNFFCDKLNTKNIIGFKNGVFDFDTGSFRDGKPDDFISYTTKTDYNPQFKSETFKEIKLFFEQLFPNKSKRKYVLRYLGSTLTHQTQKTMHLWLHKGSNGVSTLFKLLEHSLGKYFYRSSDYPLRCNLNHCQADLSSYDRRFIAVSECSKMNDINIRYICGKDRILIRNMYNIEEVTTLATWNVECNTIPRIIQGNIKTYLNCVKVIECDSVFLQKPNPDNNYFEKWAPIFSSYLIYQAMKFLKFGIPVCEEIS